MRFLKDFTSLIVPVFELVYLLAKVHHSTNWAKANFPLHVDSASHVGKSQDGKLLPLSFSPKTDLPSPAQSSTLFRTCMEWHRVNTFRISPNLSHQDLNSGVSSLNPAFYILSWREIKTMSVYVKWICIHCFKHSFTFSHSIEESFCTLLQVHRNFVFKLLISGHLYREKPPLLALYILSHIEQMVIVFWGITMAISMPLYWPSNKHQINNKTKFFFNILQGLLVD